MMKYLTPFTDLAGDDRDWCRGEVQRVPYQWEGEGQNELSGLGSFPSIRLFALMSSCVSEVPTKLRFVMP